ncbi:MAG: hotdog fold thioesterase [Bernardetiaceae bacterium]|jgi:1,4-dihydroxy-2-naphthoyl-CoA hydrolase|nr:hotdog fold thioesterase [Bernardetiaceae bacterium]
MFIKKFTLSELNAPGRSSMAQHLGIEFTELGPDFVQARMPVDHRTQQPMGLLHGGASVVLAETLGSVAGWMAAPEGFHCVGLEINANHLRGVTSGFVYGQASPLHVGRSTQVWEIKITNEEGKLVCVSRLTVAVVPSAKAAG